MLNVMSIIRTFLIINSLLFSCLMGSFFFFVQNTVIDLSVLEQYNPGKPTVLLDDQGNEWARFALDRRLPISLQQMSPHLIQAFVAAEDHAFFQHHGISWKGILRSLCINMYHGRIVQGASTITQQLVKLLFTDSKRTFMRKIKDQLFALVVEQQFSKEHILQTYLNHVFFGFGIYGVEAASQRFWGKSAAGISLDQAALLAGIVKNPSHYCPLKYPLSAQKRRNVVLHSMLQQKFITQEEYAQAKLNEVHLVVHETDLCAPHLKEAVRMALEEIVGKKKIYTGGYVVQTTLNRAIQQVAENAFKEQIILLRKKNPVVDGALISMEVKTGYIKALIGGFDFSVSKFSRALQARRQMGSTFKPLIYAAAIEEGAHFAQTEIDEPIHLNTWNPRNHNRKFEGEMTLARALAYSNNIIAIKTLLSVGYEKVMNMVPRFGIKATLHPYPSLALGCVDGTLKDAVGMFNVYANNGIYIEPHYIRWIKDEWGHKIFTVHPHQETALNSRVNGQVVKVLSIGMDRAQKRNGSQWIDSEAIGKTGTNNDSRTCLFIGATPELITGVYIGCDENESLGNNVYAIRTAFPIWKKLYMSIPFGKKKFSYDPSLKEYCVHAKTGALLDNRNDPNALVILG